MTCVCYLLYMLPDAELVQTLILPTLVLLGVVTIVQLECCCHTLTTAATACALCT
jgi:hypothetical protein